jgi:serpin B
MTRLILANAIYFYASWAKPFGELSTHDADFFLLDGEKVEVSMMENVGNFMYVKGNGFQAVSLPYVGSRFSMDIILPEIKRFAEFERKLDTKFINRIHSRSKRRKVNLSLPKFGFDSAFSLMDTLVSLGMRDAFSENADFSGMEATQELFINNVFHKACIDVDEKGTEAVAATALLMQPVAHGMRAPEKVYRFNADHPFIFMIHDSVTGSILFLGRVLDPR